MNRHDSNYGFGFNKRPDNRYTRPGFDTLLSGESPRIDSFWIERDVITAYFDFVDYHGKSFKQARLWLIEPGTVPRWKQPVLIPERQTEELLVWLNGIWKDGNPIEPFLDYLIDNWEFLRDPIMEIVNA